MRILPINYEEHINENDLEIIKEYATILDKGYINSVLKSILRDFFYDQKKTSEETERLLSGDELEILFLYKAVEQDNDLSDYIDYLACSADDYLSFEYHKMGMNYYDF